MELTQVQIDVFMTCEMFYTYIHRLNDFHMQAILIKQCKLIYVVIESEKTKARFGKKKSYILTKFTSYIHFKYTFYEGFPFLGFFLSRYLEY